MLRDDKDKAFVIHFDYEVELLQDITSSRQKLEASLDQLGTPEFSQTQGAIRMRMAADTRSTATVEAGHCFMTRCILGRTI